MFYFRCYFSSILQSMGIFYSSILQSILHLEKYKH